VTTLAVSETRDLKERELVDQRGSLAWGERDDLAVPRGHAVYIDPLGSRKASNAYEPNSAVTRRLSAANRPDRQARGGLHGS
jgi:hypothetical protein